MTNEAYKALGGSTREDRFDLTKIAEAKKGLPIEVWTSKLLPRNFKRVFNYSKDPDAERFGHNFDKPIIEKQIYLVSVDVLQKILQDGALKPPGENIFAGAPIMHLHKEALERLTKGDK